MNVRSGAGLRAGRSAGILLAVSLLASCALYRRGGDLAATAIHNELVVCDGTTQTAFWKNPTSSSIYVKKVVLWHGVPRDGQCDVGYAVYRTADSAVAGVFPRDAYANPNDAAQVVFDYAPDYIRLERGGTLKIDGNCSPMNPVCAEVRMAAWVWYTVGAP